MENFQIIHDLPKYDLLLELQFLIKSNQIYWTNKNQICLTHVEPNSSDFLFGIGHLIEDWDNRKFVDGKLVIPNKEKIYKESNFIHLCDQFKGTMFEEVYDALRDKYNIGRIRLMRMMPSSCLVQHKDPTMRIHYPIKTHCGCYMIIDNEVKHLESNQWWLTDTRKMHTAFNASYFERIHLVACVGE